MRIASISSSRADQGVLLPVWQALAARADVELHVLLTGMHVRDIDAARRQVPDGLPCHAGGADLGGAEPGEASRAMAAISRFAGETYASVGFDLVLAMGDRLDMLPAVTAGLPFNVPVAHLHGGELTLGAVDDRIRHAISKLAHVHCTASVEAAERLSRMGEEAWRISVTGGPGLDALLGQPELSAAEFAREVGLDDLAGLRLVTVHPETLAADPAALLPPILAALDARPAPTLLTAPNSDMGGAAIRAQIESFAAERPWAVFVDTLHSRLYANALRHAAVMVGNSSSGVIEAPLFGLPAVNVGPRQDGRLRGGNVTDCPADAAAIGAALDAVDPALRTRSGTSPYGDGRAAPRVAAFLADLPPRDTLLRKRFETRPVSFRAPWDTDRDCGRREAI